MRQVFEPLFVALRFVDIEVVPTLGALYHVFDLMKKKLETLPNNRWVVDIVVDRWERQLCHPLHKASCYLNLRCQYNPEITMTPEHLTAVTDVFEVLHPHDDCSVLGNEVRNYTY